jgi:hypothetical protein
VKTPQLTKRRLSSDRTVLFNGKTALLTDGATRWAVRKSRTELQWRAVPEKDRSPSPEWWWQPAFEAAGQNKEMPPLICQRLELPLSSTYAAGAEMLLATLADQTSLPWPDEFTRKFKKAEIPEPNSAETDED